MILRKINSTIIHFIILMICIELVSCQQKTGSPGVFSEMMKVCGGIAKQYGENASFSISNAKLINIDLVNSPKNDLPEDELAKYSLEIAMYVYNSLTAINDISEISITFKTHKQAGILYEKRSVAIISFNVNDLTEESNKRKNTEKTM